MKLDAKEKLMNDFNKAISSTDFKSVGATSPDFMHTLFIGMMWKLLADLPGMDTDDDSFGHDIKEELDGAEHYLECFHKTSDSQYKQMAADELRHAKILMNMHGNEEMSEEDMDAFNALEHRRNELAEKLM